MAKPRIIELPITNGEMKVRGYVTGVLKDSFYKADVSAKGTNFRTLRFGVQTDNESTVYLDLYESQQKEVFFYKRSEVKGEKGVTERVPYGRHLTFNKDGFMPIGMTNYIEQERNPDGTVVVDEKGKTKNKAVSLNNYDAVEYLSKKLTDDMPVMVLGEINFGSYKKGEDVIRSKRLTPTRIMNSTTIDFDKEDYEPISDFKQTFIFTGITLDASDKNDEKGIVEGKVVKYSSIEDVEFIVRDKKLFKNLKTKIRPYTALTAWGKIVNKTEVEEVTEDDGWGTEDTFTRRNKTFTLELEITGVDPGSFDTETYTSSEIDKALEIIANQQRAKQEFGEKTETVNDTDWGTPQSLDDDDDSWD